MDAVPQKVEQALDGGKNPTNNGIKTTSRKRNRPEKSVKSLARKGVEQTGENCSKKCSTKGSYVEVQSHHQN